MAIDHTFLATPQDFSALLTELRPTAWPPSEDDVREIADACSDLIQALDIWEGATGGSNVIDTTRGEITTAEARRILAREVALSYEGDMAVLLVPTGDERVRVELRAWVDDYQGILRRPELVLDWEHQDETREYYVSFHGKGPQWYMLSQLRDDFKENRLTPAAS